MRGAYWGVGAVPERGSRVLEEYEGLMQMAERVWTVKAGFRGDQVP